MDEQALISQEKTEEDFIALWIKQKRSAYTRKNYRRAIDKFKLFLRKRGVENAVEASVFDLQAFVELMTEQNLSNNTQKVTIDIIKSYLSYAQRVGFTSYNVGAVFTTLKKTETLSERILTKDEVRAMVTRAKDPRTRMIIRVLYGSGLRVSELCHLQWKHVVDRGGGLVQLNVLGKGEKKRHVLLSRGSSEAILSIGRGDDDEYILKNDAYHSPHLSERAVQRIIKFAARDAGVKRWRQVSPHWLRHAHATHAIEKGTPIHLVRDTLGHSNIAVTNVYAHAMPGDSSGLHLEDF